MKKHSKVLSTACHGPDLEPVRLLDLRDPHFYFLGCAQYTHFEEQEDTWHPQGSHYKHSCL